MDWRLHYITYCKRHQKYTFFIFKNGSFVPKLLQNAVRMTVSCIQIFLSIAGHSLETFLNSKIVSVETCFQHGDSFVWLLSKGLTRTANLFRQKKMFLFKKNPSKWVCYHCNFDKKFIQIGRNVFSKRPIFEEWKMMYLDFGANILISNTLNGTNKGNTIWNIDAIAHTTSN